MIPILVALTMAVNLGCCGTPNEPGSSHRPPTPFENMLEVQTADSFAGPLARRLLKPPAR